MATTLGTLFNNSSTYKSNLQGLGGQIKSAQLVANLAGEDMNPDRLPKNHEIGHTTKPVTELNGNIGDVIVTFTAPIDLGDGKSVGTVRIAAAAVGDISALTDQDKVNKAILLALADSTTVVEP